VGPIAIRRSMRRLRRHAAGVLLTIALSGAIAAHHSGIAMSDMHHDGMGTAIEMCIGAFTAIGAAVVAVAIGILALGRWPTPVDLFPTAGRLPIGARAPEARAGPHPLFSQLCVWRR
jgi:hypothetical protein